jgi:nicotinamidase-related amidase
MADYTHSALLVVDSQIGAFQPNFWGTKRSNPSYEENVSKLLAAFRASPGAHVIHIIHESINPASPLHPSKTGVAITPDHLPLPGERVISKNTNSAFITPDLQELLKQKQIWKIYFVGLSVDLCLGSTIRSASDLQVADHVDENGKVVKGDIVLIGDATAAWAKFGGKYDAETVLGAHIESLRGEFARIVSTEEALKEIGYEG